MFHRTQYSREGFTHLSSWLSSIWFHSPYHWLLAGMMGLSLSHETLGPGCADKTLGRTCPYQNFLWQPKKHALESTSRMRSGYRIRRAVNIRSPC